MALMMVPVTGMSTGWLTVLSPSIVSTGKVTITMRMNAEDRKSRIPQLRNWNKSWEQRYCKEASHMGSMVVIESTQKNLI